jgi:hypothetical protein
MALFLDDCDDDALLPAGALRVPTQPATRSTQPEGDVAANVHRHVADDEDAQHKAPAEPVPVIDGAPTVPLDADDERPYTPGSSEAHVAGEDPGYGPGDDDDDDDDDDVEEAEDDPDETEWLGDNPGNHGAELHAEDDDQRPEDKPHAGHEPQPNAAQAEIVVFTKRSGGLTKKISLDLATGKLIKDGSECSMASGTACRMPAATATELALVIGRSRTNQAIADGRLRPGLPDKVKIITQEALEELKRKGPVPNDTISRTKENIVYLPGPGWRLLDHDTTGITPEIAARLEQIGGFEKAIATILPEIESTARVVRSSTSAGLSRRDTGQKLPGSTGKHLFLGVQDVSDSKRFLDALHDRCWDAGLGWYWLSVDGKMMERSIIDRSVGSPERLIFEGGPIVEHPVVQDPEVRRPRPFEGSWIDTKTACPPLTAAEQARVNKIKEAAKAALAPEAARVREAYIEARSDELASEAQGHHQGGRPQDHREAVRRRCPAAGLRFAVRSV